MEKWMVVLVAAGFLIPYGTVLAVTGNIHGAEYVRQQEKEAAGKYRILLDREENGGYLSLEEYLPSVLAAQISPDSEMEALKAQAVIARTYIRRQMGEEKEISELSLDLDRKPREELKKIWGKTEFPEKYSRLEEAVIQTNRIVMTYDGEMIAPLFCAAVCGIFSRHCQYTTSREPLSMDKRLSLQKKRRFCRFSGSFGAAAPVCRPAGPSPASAGATPVCTAG